ncbi:MAG: hypothetical protein MSH61_00105 [Bacteroidales bacterium]|nr:hypothetical protein [Bacteroidales bacterium]
MERVLGDGLRDLLRERAEDGLLRASILDFKPKLANRYRVFPVSAIFRASILDFRARLGNRCRDFPVYPLFRALILDFKPKLANRCRVFPVSAIFRASILDFRARLANRCKLFPDYTLLRASILDFRARLANRCKYFPVYSLLRASILDFKPRLGNRCSTIVVAVENGPPAAVVAATNSASDSVLRCSKGKWLACYGRSGNDLPRPILFFVAAKKNGPPATPSLLQGRTARRQNDRCGCRRGQDATKAA